MQYRDHLNHLPPHMHAAITDWIERGWQPGDFLTALLSNDFMEACGRADEHNLAALSAWAVYLYNYAPAGCYGSPGNVEAWCKRGGLEGMEREFRAAESEAREQLT